ncbi:MAG: hypothetical protein DRP11_01305 [Candidatus Aenigmatarchaeota archaeon]|nr:MAG: hypothetical protein DRP11_01305 [Candidatus Aenigmarchaeota archaeon]
MKNLEMKALFLGLFVATTLVLIGTASANGGGRYSGCTTIQDGTLVDSNGEPLVLGFDRWGYNYQAHIFSGPYCYYDRHYNPESPDWNDGFCDIWLVMKWNDAWLSNKDCDGDGELDRHYGYDSYIGSGAWLTNHMWGTYDNGCGETCRWNYFVKIVAVPEDAQLIDGIWYTSDGKEIGPAIWGSFAIIQQVYNDPCGGYHGIEYLSPTSAGFGYYK